MSYLRPESALTRAARQKEMQNWTCCFCAGRHAWWFHDHPGRDGAGRKKERSEDSGVDGR